MVNLRHKIPKTAKNQQEHNWGGGGGKEALGACDPPCPLCKPFFKQTTYNIQVAKTGEYPLFDTVRPHPLKNPSSAPDQRFRSISKHISICRER